LSPEARSRLATQARRESLGHLLSLELLARLGQALDDALVPWVVVKGPALAELCYGGLTRKYGDLDLVVPGHHLRAAIGALGNVGADLADKNWPLLERVGAGEINLAVKHFPGIDLHWHVVNQLRARETFKIPMDELFERRRQAQLGEVSAWVLEANDFLAHVALHAAMSGANRLGWLLDIERTVATQPPDWDILVQRCRSWRVGLPVGAALARAQSTLGAAVPEEVLGRLVGGTLERLLYRSLDNWAPEGRLPGGRSVSGGVMRALRADLVTTAAQLPFELWEMVNPHRQREASKIDPSDPHQVTFDPGDPEGFDRYLEMVESTDRFGHRRLPRRLSTIEERR